MNAFDHVNISCLYKPENNNQSKFINISFHDLQWRILTYLTFV